MKQHPNPFNYGLFYNIGSVLLHNKHQPMYIIIHIIDNGKFDNNIFNHMQSITRSEADIYCQVIFITIHISLSVIYTPSILKYINYLWVS
jgi:hypothetical protein